MTKRKLKIGIIFGGKSAEHEVSLQSAKNVVAALDKMKYAPVLIKIDKSGKWRCNGNPVALLSQGDGKISNLTGDKGIVAIDVAFPILHGPFGEDGTVQGLLKLANIPFVGAGVLGSAVGMDKDVMKRLLGEAGIPVGKFISLRSGDPLPTYRTVKKKLGAPFFIKPANMGSSVGIRKVHNAAEYLPAVKKAFTYDVKIVIEENIKGREIECAVLGNDKPKASVPGEVISSHEFYSYEAKYLDEKGARLQIPAKISKKKAKKVKELAIKTFKTLSAEGLGRVDLFLKNNGRIVVNEINTMPGFTKISMYPKLWEASGVSYAELIDKLIQLAGERFSKEQNLKTSYGE